MTGLAAVQPATAVSSLHAAGGLADGELVILNLKPSWWCIPMKRASWLSTLAIVWGGLALIEWAGWYDLALHPMGLVFIAVACGVLVWQAVDRATRVYLLTDRRVLRVSGVFSRTIVEIPLQQVSTVVMYRTFTARLTGVGSILFTSSAAGSGQAGGDLVWYLIDDPVGRVRTVRQTLARYGGGHGGVS